MKDAQNLDITAKYAALYTLDDFTLVYDKNADVRTPIASLTKIMTTIVALENIEDLNQSITLTKKDFEKTSGFSCAGFKVGDTATFLDLLYGIMLPSGADAVNATVNNTLKDNFVDEMNKTAKKIGMNNTHFSNAIGKDNDLNYSTANDVAKMLNYAFKNETFKDIFTARTYTTTNGLKLNSTLKKYSKDSNINNVLGAKSGNTTKASLCLASIASYDETNYLAVVISSNKSNKKNAVLDSLKLYDYYSDNYSYQVIFDESKIIKSLPIESLNNEKYDVYIDDEIKLFLKNDAKINYVYEGIEKIPSNTLKGTKLGIVKVYDKENLIYETDAYLLKDIALHENTAVSTFNYEPIFTVSIISVIAILFIIVIVLIHKKRKNK